MSTATTVPTDCPLCPQNNLLKVPIIAKAEHAYLITAYGSPGYYLIIPSAHAETPAEIPDNWWASVSELLTKVPDLSEHYNLSFNVGKLAGQTVKHLHLWVIPREGGLPSSGLGLAALISKANEE
jgi:diadenosine tetraphosphate (Ap4A) HIT family hydrolase